MQNVIILTTEHNLLVPSILFLLLLLTVLLLLPLHLFLLEMIFELFEMIQPRDSILFLQELLLANPGLQLFQTQDGEVCLFAICKRLYLVLDIVQFVLFSMRLGTKTHTF